jgi:hypothetical protein
MKKGKQKKNQEIDRMENKKELQRKKELTGR